MLTYYEWILQLVVDADYYSRMYGRSADKLKMFDYWARLINRLLDKLEV